MLTLQEGSDKWENETFIWQSIYPSWWWACDHNRADKHCMYCSRQHQSQSFGEKFYQYASSINPSNTVTDDIILPHGDVFFPPISGNGGDPRGIDYNQFDRHRNESSVSSPSHSRVDIKSYRPSAHYYGNI